VAQSITQHEVRSNTPVVLTVEAYVDLRNVCVRIPGIDAERRRTAAEFADAIRGATGAAICELLRSQTSAHDQGRAAITLDTGDWRIGSGNRIVVRVEDRAKSSGKRPG